MSKFLTYTEMEAPPADLYYPPRADMSRCLAVRTDSDHADTRWSPAVYELYQCKKAPVSGSTLCETCQGRLDRQHADSSIGWNGGSGWLGLYTSETSYDIQPYAHTAGTPWFARAKWTGVPKAPTARKEGRLDRVPRVEQREIDRFLRSSCTLDIETLSTRNQISAQQLRDMISVLKGFETGVPKFNVKASARTLSAHGAFNKGTTKPELCVIIRALMRGEDVDIRPRKTRSVAASETESTMELDQVHALAEVQDEEIQALKAKKKSLKAAKKALEAEIADLKAALEARTDENETLLAEMEKMEAEIHALKAWKTSVLATVSA